MKRFLTHFSKHKAEKTIEGDTPKSPSVHTNDSTASENTSVNSSIAFNPEPTRQLVKSLKVLDLSLNYDQPPVQPNIVYPYKSIGKSKRSFNSTWYKQYPWTTTLDYSRCAKLIKSTMEQLINLRSEKIFINIYNEAVSLFQTSNIEPNDTLRPTREQRISSTLDNYLTYSTLGASTSRKEKQNMSSKDTENEFKRVFFQILDHMNNEMIYRFTQNNEILNYIHASDPKSNEFLNSDLLVKLGNMYQPYTTNDFIEVLKNQCLIGKSLFLDNLTLSDLHQQISNYGETFEHVKKIIELVMVIPVSSASAERSFSTMRRVKTYLRSTMKSSRLSSLTLLSIDFENSDKLLKDPTAVLEVFSSMKNRRIQFQI